MFIFLESFLGDSRLWIEGIRRNQVIAWLVLASGLLSIIKIRNRQPLTSNSLNKNDVV